MNGGLALDGRLDRASPSPNGDVSGRELFDITDPGAHDTPRDMLDCCRPTGCMQWKSKPTFPIPTGSTRCF